jgi:hypothetical protein
MPQAIISVLLMYGRISGPKPLFTDRYLYHVASLTPSLSSAYWRKAGSFKGLYFAREVERADKDIQRGSRKRRTICNALIMTKEIASILKNRSNGLKNAIARNIGTAPYSHLWSLEKRVCVTTLILNEYQQSSKSSIQHQVLVF